MQKQKVEDFLSFLNEVNQDTIQENISEGFEDINIQDVNQLYELINRQKIKIQQQELDLIDKDETIDLLKKKNQKQKENFQELAQQQKRKHDFDFKEQNDIFINKQSLYEDKLCDNIEKIKRFINDKQQLVQQLDQSVQNMKNNEINFNIAFENQKNKYLSELKVIKDKTLQQEKVKYDKWKDQQKKQIKDNTVKALEPQIQTILDNNKKQIQQLKDVQQKQIEEMKQSFQDEYEIKNKTCLLEMQINYDCKIKTYIKENEQLTRKQFENMEDNFHEEKQKIKSSFLEEKNQQSSNYNERITELEYRLKHYQQQEYQKE